MGCRNCSCFWWNQNVRWKSKSAFDCCLPVKNTELIDLVLLAAWLPTYEWFMFCIFVKKSTIFCAAIVTLAPWKSNNCCVRCFCASWAKCFYCNFRSDVPTRLNELINVLGAKQDEELVGTVHALNQQKKRVANHLRRPGIIRNWPFRLNPE